MISVVFLLEKSAIALRKCFVPDRFTNATAARNIVQSRFRLSSKNSPSRLVWRADVENPWSAPSSESGAEFFHPQRQKVDLILCYILGLDA